MRFYFQPKIFIVQQNNFHFDKIFSQENVKKNATLSSIYLSEYQKKKNNKIKMLIIDKNMGTMATKRT